MKWTLTQPDDGEPQLDIREDDEDLSLGFAYMRALVEAGEGSDVWVDSGSGPGWVRYSPQGDR
jgi:hypothetical protein